MASSTKTSRRRNFSLVVAEEDGRVLTVGDATLAVFSGEGEAELFRYCKSRESGWKVRRTSPEELVSLLRGRCAEARMVALDPSPEMFAGRMVGLVSMNKDLFVERILQRDRVLGLILQPHFVT